MLAFTLFGDMHWCMARGWQETRDTLRSLGIDIRSRVVESASENIDISPLLDDLRQLEEVPLSISQATAAELQQIPGVSAQTAFRIVSYRDRHAVEGKGDLNNVSGIEPEVIDALEPYVTFSGNSPRSMSQPTLSLRTRIVRKLSQPPSSAGVQYLGPPEKVYNRIAGRFSLSSEPHRSKGSAEVLNGASVSFGLLTSKDPGEKNYADLVRGQLVMNIPGCSTRLVLGDYLVDGGQGLVFWRPTGFSKGGEATSGVARNGAGVWPSLSTGQSMTFRGIGVNIQPRGVGFHLFYSDKPLDATSDSGGTITHLSSDDLHRTETELAKRDRLREKTFGGRMTLDLAKGVKLGMSCFSSRFDEMVVLSGPFGFQGKQTSAFGLDGLYTDGSVSTFAEIAQDHMKACAAVAGFSAYLRSDLSVAFLFRSYSKNYNNFHSSGFSESGDGCKNESGVYAGLTCHPTPWLRIAAFVDQFTFPWRTFGSLMTSQGHEYFLGADLRLRDNVEIDFQFRQKDKSESKTTFDVADNIQSGIESIGRNTYRATLRFEPVGWLRWQNCVEIVTIGLEHSSVQERGMLFFQDMTANLGRDFTVRFRAVAFHTDSYNSRVYEYEADLPGAFSCPALFESGFRCYILGCYRWRRTFTVSVKYSQTSKEKSSQGSAGLDNQFSVQLDLVL
ncbi:MAG: helix-hairpin-helix domain-containing protein [Ignavibacteriales bacterium]|nr:helix-hairpin-helix domain-containing protein [Ignavibacteriales bacterium]